MPHNIITHSNIHNYHRQVRIGLTGKFIDQKVVDVLHDGMQVTSSIELLYRGWGDVRKKYINSDITQTTRFG